MFPVSSHYTAQDSTGEAPNPKFRPTFGAECDKGHQCVSERADRYAGFCTSIRMLVTAIHLGDVLPRRSCSRPEDIPRAAKKRLLLGLAPGGVYLAA